MRSNEEVGVRLTKEKDKQMTETLNPRFDLHFANCPVRYSMVINM